MDAPDRFLWQSTIVFGSTALIRASSSVSQGCRMTTLSRWAVRSRLEKSALVSSATRRCPATSLAAKLVPGHTSAAPQISIAVSHPDFPIWRLCRSPLEGARRTTSFLDGYPSPGEPRWSPVLADEWLRFPLVDERITRRVWGIAKAVRLQITRSDPPPRRALFILGCQRSGTTMVIDALGRDWRAKTYSEFSAVNVPADGRRPWSSAP